MRKCVCVRVCVCACGSERLCKERLFASDCECRVCVCGCLFLCALCMFSCVYARSVMSLHVTLRLFTSQTVYAETQRLTLPVCDTSDVTAIALLVTPKRTSPACTSLLNHSLRVCTRQRLNAQMVYTRNKEDACR